MSKVDGRGSENQRLLFHMLKELYPMYNVEYEYLLPNGTRYDLFLPTIGLAVEYDGEQHHKYNSFWHKDINGFIDQKKSDISKDDFSNSIGVKLVRIPFNKMVKSSEELKTLIDNTPYPDVEYNLYFDDTKKVNSYEEEQKQKRREYNKKIYQERKERERNARKVSRRGL